MLLRRDAQIVVRIAGPLREELERVAREQGCELSDVVRGDLIEAAARRVSERAKETA